MKEKIIDIVATINPSLAALFLPVRDYK